jgi:hypothetical protein
MADDKRGREEQARDADTRQRERDIAAELERWDETEPPVEATELNAVANALDAVSFPATATEVMAAVDDKTIDAPDGTYAVPELLPDTENMEFESSAAVRTRLQRPTVAASLARIVEAAESVSNLELGRSQLEAYEKTLRELAAIDADDDDEGIAVITDWLIEQILENERLPGSRDVRREAAKFCRENGYEIRNDQWLGL